MKEIHSTTRLLILFFIIFLAINLKFKGSGYTDQYNALISVASLLFGIFIAFSIYNHQSRLTTIKQLLRTDDAYLISIFQHSKVFGKDVSEKVLKLIDEYLIAQIDYKLSDFQESDKQFMKLYDYIVEITPKSNKEVVAYQNILGILNSSTANRKMVEPLVNQKVTKLEWSSIYMLLGLICFLTFAFDNKSFVAALFTALLATAGLILVFVLRQLDSLRWQEDKWIWKPLHKLFSELGLTPYYSEQVLAEERTTIKKGQKIRVAHYPQPYPDMSGKEVEIIELT